MSQKTPLAKVKFSLVPDEIKLPTDLADPDSHNLEDVYRICFFAVFGTMPGKLFIGNKEMITDNASECRCSVRLYMLAVMLAHANSSPEREFQPSMLIRQNSISRVESYREACASRFGTFDVTAFSTLLQHDLNKLENSLKFTELAFAEYVIGCILRRVKNAARSFYAEKELSVQPPWGAVEPSYSRLVLVPYLDGKLETTPVISRHRHDVIAMARHLRKNRADARLVFKTREEIVPKVVKEVLAGRRVNADELFSHSPVTDMETFWVNLGKQLE